MRANDNAADKFSFRMELASRLVIDRSTIKELGRAPAQLSINAVASSSPSSDVIAQLK